jgi:hypothetical protein
MIEGGIAGDLNRVLEPNAMIEGGIAGGLNRVDPHERTRN